MQQDTGAAARGEALKADVSAGIKTTDRTRGTGPAGPKFGRLQSLRFQGVATDGMDVFDATFTRGHMQWWIAPLAADGRIVWVGFARAMPKN